MIINVNVYVRGGTELQEQGRRPCGRLTAVAQHWRMGAWAERDETAGSESVFFTNLKSADPGEVLNIWWTKVARGKEKQSFSAQNKHLWKSQELRPGSLKCIHIGSRAMSPCLHGVAAVHLAQVQRADCG